MNNGERVFRVIRRYLGYAENSNTPEVDAIIREECELNSFDLDKIFIPRIAKRIAEAPSLSSPKSTP